MRMVDAIPKSSKRQPGGKPKTARDPISSRPRDEGLCAIRLAASFAVGLAPLDPPYTRQLRGAC